MRIIIGFMPLLGYLPLFVLRFMGWCFGRVSYALLKSRRRVTLINLAICFPNLSELQRKAMAKRVFVYYARSLLDRAWLWNGPKWLLNRRLTYYGDWSFMQNDEPIIIFLPHFVGLDAAALGLSKAFPHRRYCTIFTGQSSPAVTDWMIKGRNRYTMSEQFPRGSGVREIIRSLRKNNVLVLLPDMNYDPKESIFVPFYGHLACTVTSLSRFAALGRAKVIPLIPRMTEKGYGITMLSPWESFPSSDEKQDTLHMNHMLESYINTMPDQYFWVHRRFKDLPEGMTPPY